MSAVFSWVDLAGFVVSTLSLAVTVAIFLLGRRLTFRQERERATELEAKAWKVLAAIRNGESNSDIIVMNVARYRRDYTGVNTASRRGYAFGKYEFIEIAHDGIEVVLKTTECYVDERGNRTLAKTTDRAANVLVIGHIPWRWIEDIDPDGDAFDGYPIFFVRFRAPGREPFDGATYREAQPVQFGPAKRNYYPHVPELGVRRPRPIADRWRLLRAIRVDRQVSAADPSRGARRGRLRRR